MDERGTGEGRAALPMEESVPLPPTAAETTAERPWPVGLLSQKIRDYVNRMSIVWVRGELVQVSRGKGALVFMTLRDTHLDASFSVSMRASAFSRLDLEPQQGSEVVVQCKPTFWGRRGTLQLEAYDIRAVGIGDLLQRLEQLKQALFREGLFDAERKRPLPFLPHTIGLICGRKSAAERDVIVNAEKRWPAVRFETREVAVQGMKAVGEVSEALRELDSRDDVDVIIISRGGGSLEDLLPFSDESLVRLAAAARTPIVSAIGHEVDTPLLDLVADYRASTPTDAAKTVVPDMSLERAQLNEARSRSYSALASRIEREREAIAHIRERPAFAEPHTMIESHAEAIDGAIASARATVSISLERARERVRALADQARALSPLHTLERGYAVVQGTDGTPLTHPSEAPAGTRVSIRLASGRLRATSLGEESQEGREKS